jgi:transposase InsO family protein
MILHSDQGSVYASKAFNELLPMYGITRSMSRAGTPTDNAAMEAINGWIKAELFMDLHVTGENTVEKEIDEYISFFNEQRPAYSLNYLTPKQYRESNFATASV